MAFYRLAFALTGALLLAVGTPSSAGLLAAIFATVLATVLLARTSAPGRAPRQAGRIRQVPAARAGIPKLTDPDAPGRSRPRAPCAPALAA